MNDNLTPIADALSALHREAQRWESVAKSYCAELEAERKLIKIVARGLIALPSQWNNTNDELAVSRLQMLNVLKDNGLLKEESL